MLCYLDVGYQKVLNFGKSRFNIWSYLYSFNRSGQWTGTSFIGIPWRELYKSGFIPSNSGSYTYSATNKSSPQRIVVRPNGTDILYMVKNYPLEWNTTWYQPSNDCESYAKCGPNSICSIVKDGKAKCNCLRGLSWTKILYALLSLLWCTEYCQKPRTKIFKVFVYPRFPAQFVEPVECGKLDSRLHQKLTSRLSGQQTCWGRISFYR